MINFNSSRLSADDAKLYFSNSLSERDGKFYMTFPKFDSDNSGKYYITPIVELPINHKNIEKLKELNSLINPTDEENYRIVFAIEVDDNLANGDSYSLYPVKIPKEKIKQSTKLEDLDDRSKFMEKVEFQLAYCSKITTPSHSQTLPNLSTSSAPPASSYPSLSNYPPALYCPSTSSAHPASYFPQTLPDLSTSSAPPASSYPSLSNYPPALYCPSTSSTQPPDTLLRRKHPNSNYSTFCGFLDTLIPNCSCAPSNKEDPKKGIANQGGITRFSC